MLCQEKSCAESRDRKKYPFFAGLFLAILPKCPFCVLAFSTTVAFCGGAGTFSSSQTHSSASSFLISALVCGITLLSMLLSSRGSKTLYAVLLALAGSFCILYSVSRGGGLALYYSGVVLVFCGLWLNGSLAFWLAKTRDFFNKGKRKSLKFTDQKLK